MNVNFVMALTDKRSKVTFSTWWSHCLHNICLCLELHVSRQVALTRMQNEQTRTEVPGTMVVCYVARLGLSLTAM